MATTEVETTDSFDAAVDAAAVGDLLILQNGTHQRSTGSFKTISKRLDIICENYVEGLALQDSAHAGMACKFKGRLSWAPGASGFGFRGIDIDTGLWTSDAYESGSWLVSASNGEIEDCVLRQAGGMPASGTGGSIGITFGQFASGDTQRCIDMALRRIRCLTIGDRVQFDHPLYFKNALRPKVEDSIFYDNTGFAFHLYTRCIDGRFSHCLVDRSGSALTFSGGADSSTGTSTYYASSGNIFEWCIFTNSLWHNLVESYWGGAAGTGNIVRDCIVNNHITGTTGRISTANGGFTTERILDVNPGYLNPTAGVFKLAATSPAVTGAPAGQRFGPAAIQPGAAPPPNPNPNPTPTAGAQRREVPLGVYASNNTWIKSGSHLYVIRFRLDADEPIHRFIFAAELRPLKGGASGVNYAGGTGGTVYARLCRVNSDGTPNLANPLATESFSPTARYDLVSTWIANTDHRWLYMACGGVQPGAGEYAVVITNSAAAPTTDFFSVLSAVTHPAVAGPNGINNRDPNASGAVAGLNPLEAVGWSVDGGATYVWSRGVGGPLNLLVGYYDNNDGGWESCRLPAYGYTVAAGDAAMASRVPVQPHIFDGTDGKYDLKVKARRDGSYTHVGGVAPAGKQVGALRVTNVRTGDVRTTAVLGGGNTGPVADVVDTLLTGLDTVWSLDFDPAGRLWFTERAGRVKLWDPATPGTAPVTALTISGTESLSAEEGLQGLALDPSFATNNFVYLYYSQGSTATTITNRVVRYTFNPTAKTLGSPLVLVDAIPGYQYHVGGRIKFGPDGFLYIATGDAANNGDSAAAAAQNNASLAGKILRVNKADGTGAAGNTTFGGRVFAKGFRNPQGLAWDEDGVLWTTEHGPTASAPNPDAHDEVNRVPEGFNGGWPRYYGDETSPYSWATSITMTPAQTAPKAHSDIRVWAPAGAMFYTGTKMGTQWGRAGAQKLIFAGLGFTGRISDGVQDGEAIYRLTIDAASNNVVGGVERVFHEVYGRIRDVIQGPDGYIYFCTSNRDGRGTVGTGDDKILRIRPVTEAGTSEGKVIVALSSPLPKLAGDFITVEMLTVGAEVLKTATFSGDRDLWGTELVSATNFWEMRTVSPDDSQPPALFVLPHDYRTAAPLEVTPPPVVLDPNVVGDPTTNTATWRGLSRDKERGHTGGYNPNKRIKEFRARLKGTGTTGASSWPVTMRARHAGSNELIGSSAEVLLAENVAEGEVVFTPAAPILLRAAGGTLLVTLHTGVPTGTSTGELQISADPSTGELLVADDVYADGPNTVMGPVTTDNYRLNLWAVLEDVPAPPPALPPDPVTNLRVVVAAEGVVDLAWDLPTTTFDEVIARVSTTTTPTTATDGSAVTLDGDRSGLLETGVTNDQDRFYTIFTKRGALYSPSVSITVRTTATPPPPPPPPPPPTGSGVPPIPLPPATETWKKAKGLRRIEGG